MDEPAEHAREHGRIAVTEDPGLLALGEELRLHAHRLVEAQLHARVDGDAVGGIGGAGEAQVEPGKGGVATEEADLEVDQPVQPHQRVGAAEASSPGSSAAAMPGMNSAPRRTQIWRKSSSLLGKNRYTEPTANPASSAISFSVASANPRLPKISSAASSRWVRLRSCWRSRRWVRRSTACSTGGRVTMDGSRAPLLVTHPTCQPEAFS